MKIAKIFLVLESFLLCCDPCGVVCNTKNLKFIEKAKMMIDSPIFAIKLNWEKKFSNCVTGNRPEV